MHTGRYSLEYQQRYGDYQHPETRKKVLPKKRKKRMIQAYHPHRHGSQTVTGDMYPSTICQTDYKGLVTRIKGLNGLIGTLSAL